MPYEFLAKNGLISQGNITATGSLTVTQNISASRTGSFGAVAIGTNNLQDSLTIGSSISESLLIQNNTYNNLSNGIQITSNLGFLNGASANLNFARWTGTDSTDHATIGQSFNVSSWDLQFSTGRQNTGSAINYFTSSAVRMTIKAVTGNVGIGTTSPVNKLQVEGNISGSSFTSSISNAVGFLGTSSWAQNVISASYVLSSSFATTAQTANALNPANSYTIAGLTNNGTLSQQGTLSMGSAYQLFATTGTAGAPGISFVGDSNTGIYSPGSDTIGFSISGSERMRIASDGNVGIGTTSPLLKLDVRGALQVAGGADGIYISNVGDNSAYDNVKLYYTGYNSGSPRIYLTPRTQPGSGNLNTYLYLQSNVAGGPGSNTMGLLVDGNVGIGTTSPTARLHVSGSTGGVFEVDTSGSATTFYVSASGNVGIGTTNPVTKLAILGGDDKDTGPIISLSGNSINQFESGRIRFTEANIAASPFYQGAYVHYDGSNNVFNIGVHGNVDSLTSSDVNAISILRSNAFVGIGTTSPATTLNVSGSTRISAGELQIEGDNAAIRLYRTTGINYLDWASGQNFYLGTVTSIGGAGRSNKMVILDNGNVGIGTTSPSVKLNVSGSSYFQGYVNVHVNQINTIGTSGDSANLQVNSINIHPNSTTETMYIRRLNSGNFQIQTVLASANSGQLHLQPYGGSVGIGTTSPAFLLDVSGSSRHGYQSSDTHQFTGSVSLSGGLSLTNLTASNISASGTGSFGIVGIGTTSPLAALDVRSQAMIGDASIGGVAYQTLSVGGHTRIHGTYRLQFGSANGGYASMGITGTATGTITFNTWDGSADRERLRIVNTDGNVGIGTTTVSRKLHTYTDTGPVMRLQSSGSNASIEFIPSSGHNRYNWLIGAQQNISDAFEITPSTATNGTTFSTPSLLIKSDGNVGIGSTSPAAKFVVFASAITTTSKDSYAVAIGNSNTDLTFGSDATYGYIQTWGSKPLYINNQGNNIIFGANVGIGTTNPASRLQIGNLTATQTSATETLSLGGTYSNTAGSNIKLKVYEDGGGGAIGGMSVSSGQMEVNTWTAGKIAFYRGTTQTAIIDASGQVGIGTTSPNSKLEVAGTAGTAIISVNNTTAGRSGSFGIDSSGVYIRNSNNGDYFDLENASGTSRFRLVYDNNTFLNTTYTSVGSLTSSGSKLSVFGNLSVGSTYGSTAAPSNGAIFQGGVGIGTTNPSYAFDVYTNAPADALMSLRTSGSANARIYFDASNGDLIGSDYCYLGQESGSLNFVINTSNVAGDIHLQPKFASATDGRLIVSGSSQFGRSSTSNHQFTGSVSVSNNVTCLSLTETSTEAVKYNIVPLPSQLENVLKLTPVSFNYKTNNKHSIGLIAEEVAKIYPEFTSENNDSISYGKMTSVLIQSIKELKSIIDTQQKQIEELLNKFKQL